LLRKVAGLALAASVLVSVAGCSFNPKPETLQSYAPSDGSGVELNFTGKHRNEGLKFRNFLLLNDGTTGHLFGTVINSGNKSENVLIQVFGDSTKEQTLTVEPGRTFVFNASNPATFTVDGAPGSLVEMRVGLADGTLNAKISVPVLDGTIDYYQNLLTPSPMATEAPSAEPTGTATPAASPSASPSATK
jgi:hypothetical protein